MTGTFINIATVLTGCILGLILGKRLPHRIRETVMKGLGLFTLIVGLQMAFKTDHVLITLCSIIVGGIIGELLNIQAQLDRLGQALQARFGASSDNRFSEGFVTTSLIFCVGPMTILGSLQDGLSGDYQLLAIKSMLDGFVALTFAAGFGIGVAFSAVTILIVQGSISLAASHLDSLLTEAMITEMVAAGGLIILGIGFVLLELLPIRVANYLPALLIAPALVVITSQLPF
ncbi:MAG: DUF554 domain-containing protein [Candidatus Latescibacteria bacterium]|jgi:hypothetical protein|nr:DUF554 domain-containing protein [Candidatus Latescibacterota bacterium]